MNLRPISIALVLASVLTTLTPRSAAAQIGGALGHVTVPDRVTSPIVASVRTQTNPVHRLATPQNDLGRVSATQVFNRMIMLLQGSDTQKSDLTQLLADQQDPNSPQYHKWLSPQQFGERFGPTQNDLSKVTNWLTSQGFTVEPPSNGRRFLLFTGTSAQVESAFQTEMHTYKVNGKTQFANATAASVPSALAPVVRGMAKLDSFGGPQPQIYTSVKPQALVGAGLLTTPADLTAIYNANPLKAAGLQGEGQSIALIEQSNINPQDIADFRKITGLPAAKLNIIVNGPDPGLIADETEAIVDTEFAGAFTPNATLNFIVSASTQFNGGIDLSTVYAVDNLISPITSLSYGTCEAAENTYYASEALLFQLAYEQGAAEGISHFVSSGDQGGDACLYFGVNTGYGVNALGDTPWNVSVGGTEFNMPYPAAYFPLPSGIATGYIPETAWNDYVNPHDGRPLAGAGGSSITFAKPVWQAGLGVPADGARDLPDVSLVAGDNLAYLLCERDIGANCAQNIVAGEIGTSLASPSWASIQALVNQKNNIVNGTGNPNPTYYRLAASSKSPFHDITVGDTKVPDPNGVLTGYTTTPGYDLATGLGSVDVNALATSWGPPTGAGTTTVALTTTATHITHGSSLGSTVKVASGSTTTPTGDIALLAGAQGVGQLTLNTAGSASVTFGAAYGVFLPGGSYNLTARYAGDPNFAPATSNAVAVTVDAEPTVTSAGPSTQTVYYGTPVSVSAATFGNNSGSGYVAPGTYTFSDSGKTIGTASVAATGESFAYASYGASATLTLSGSTSLTAGTHKITAASPPASPSFLASTSPAVTVTVFKAPPLLSVAADHTTPAANSKVTLTAVLYPYYFPSPVTGTVTFYDGSTILGTASLTTEAADGGYVVTFPTQFASGVHYITATYGGDANDSAVAAGAVNVTVAAKSSSTTTISAQTFGLAGNNVTIVAHVLGDSSGVSPTGTVTFTDAAANSGAGATVGTATVTNGTATLATTSLSVGSHRILATYAGDSNFAGSLSQSLTVTVGDFTLTANPASTTVTAGQSTSAIAIAYAGTSNFASFSSGVTFACSGLPTGATCSFSTNPLVPTVGSTGTTSGTTNLTIATTGPTLTKASLDHPDMPSGTRFTLSMAALLALGLPLAFRRRRLLPTLLALAMLAVLGGGIIGCSGNSTPTYNVTNPGTAAGTSTVTVTATLNGGSTYGTLAHTATVSLVVTSATGQ